ncbi:MAG: carbohydrate binding domain-containing protein [Ignavibacteriaceae bacterium]
MKTKFIYFGYIILISLLYFHFGCDQSPVEPEIGENLLANGSFEINNIPTLNGWRFGNEQLAKLINEAPAIGGNWSLQLTSDWAPTTGYVYTPVVNLKSGDIVELSAYVRATSQFGGEGIIYLSYNNHRKSASSNDTVWNKISIIDTLSLAPNDTLWVTLSAPITEIVPFKQLFDLVKLKKISKNSRTSYKVI